MVLLILLIILISTVICLYLFIKRSQTYWERKGLYTYYGMDRTAGITYKAIKERGLKHGAYSSFFRTCYMPVDLDIIKAIMNKNSDHFINRGLYCNPKVDPLTGILPQLENQQWKYERSIVTPIFSSGKSK